jgi:hypothetical protein
MKLSMKMLILTKIFMVRKTNCIFSNNLNLDFHDVYLTLHYEINGQSSRYKCNHGRPIVCLFFMYFSLFITPLASTETHFKSMDTYEYLNPFPVRNLFLNIRIFIHCFKIRCRKSRWDITM